MLERRKLSLAQEYTWLGGDFEMLLNAVSGLGLAFVEADFGFTAHLEAISLSDL